MRKQTKFVAALSATAVMALGASMMSYAASNWVYEDGVWVYYDKDGEAVTEEWKKSGSDWYWLNEDGEMATETLVEDDDDYFYVDETGAMVTNQWIAIENDDYDEDDEDEPENHWYYFGANGKAYKSSASSSSVVWKTIDGEKYTFDDEGKMQFGWIDEEGDRITGDDAWQTGVYYCGDENDGHRRTKEWALIDIVDENWDEDQTNYGSSANVFDDEDQTRWFWFKSNGKKIYSDESETINGKKYSFDEYGRMNANWVFMSGATMSNAAYSKTNTTNSQGTESYTSQWQYFGDPEDGARLTKGWFKATPDEMLYKGKYDEGASYWYYSDNDGNLVANEIKTIDGKKYLFDAYGRMKTGLYAIKFDADSTTSVLDIMDSEDATAGILAGDSKSGYYFDTEDNFKDNITTILNDGYHMYYFNGDGVMQTGKQTIDIDGDDFTFLFNKSGSAKGQGKIGEDDDKFYAGGMLMAADKEDKYAVVKIVKDTDGYKSIEIFDTDEFLSEAKTQNLLKATGTAAIELAGKDADDYEEYYYMDAAKLAELENQGTYYKVVNASGKVQDTKSKAKDGEDRCYEIKNETIVSIYVED